MVTAASADYPLLNVFWTMLLFTALVIWFWLLITVFSDIFRRHDIGGGSKTIWILFVIVFPYLGVFIYLISQSSHMAERNMKQMQAQQEQFDSYVQSVAGGSAAQIAKAKELLDSGAITQAEFDALKAKALSA